MKQGVSVEWDVHSGDKVIGTKRGVVLDRQGSFLAIRGECVPGDLKSSPFLTRTVDSVRLIPTVPYESLIQRA